MDYVQFLAYHFFWFLPYFGVIYFLFWAVDIPLSKASPLLSKFVLILRNYFFALYFVVGIGHASADGKFDLYFWILIAALLLVLCSEAASSRWQTDTSFIIIAAIATGGMAAAMHYFNFTPLRVVADAYFRFVDWLYTLPVLSGVLRYVTESGSLVVLILLGVILLILLARAIAQVTNRATRRR